MGELLGPYRASLTQARRRRAVRLLFAAMLAVFGLIAWTNYPSYRSDHRLILELERGRVDPEALLRHGIACDPGGCSLVDRSGVPIGPRFPVEAQVVPGEGKQVPGGPFIPPEGVPITAEQIRQQLPQVIPAYRAAVAREATLLTPRADFYSRARAAGTFWGVLFVVLIASTIIGAEWRWGVWPTLLTHEPRRGRMLLAKLASVWTMVAVALVLVLGFTAGLDVIFRHISSVGRGGGPGNVTLARTSGKALLSLELYATFAVALTTALRTSLAGVGSLLLLLGDGLSTHRWTWLRHFLPTQQIARLLLANFDGVTGGSLWFPVVTAGKSVCSRTPEGFDLCHQVALPPVPQWRAALVLIGWIALASLLAWMVLRVRDAPQSA